MAVADYRVNGVSIGVRGFPVPKRAAELKYWYKAAKAALPHLPDWDPRIGVGADITVETIILDWVSSDGHGRHQLIIARKRRLF